MIGRENMDRRVGIRRSVIRRMTIVTSERERGEKGERPKSKEVWVYIEKRK